MHTAYTTVLFLVVRLSLGASELQCPQVSYTGSDAKLTCIGANSTHAYSKPVGSTASTCIVGQWRCIDAGDDKGEVINSTHTTLTIPDVKQSDAGEWGCTVGKSETPSRCTMAVANIPQCNISSDQNTDMLTLHEELSLTVDIQEYYCSAQYTFSLLVGEDRVHLPISETVNTPTSTTANTNVNITSSSLGLARLAFLCHNKQQILSCDGIKIINVVPGCRVISDKAIKTVALHEELELSVDFKNYFCSAAYNVTLQVGKVSQPLSATAIWNRLRNMTVNITLNITGLHFGDVRLIFLCQDKKQVLTCDGLELIQGISVPTTLPTRNTAITATPSSESNIGIIAAVVSFTGIVVVSLIVVVCCYRRRGNQWDLTLESYKPSPEETVHNPVHIAAESKQVEA